jgi:hypothetical protein
MMKRSLSSVLASAALAVTVSLALGASACGGGGTPKPQPLSRHFEESFIDPLPVAEQQAVIASKGGYETARKENAKAKADLDASKVQLDTATNDKRAADLDLSSAKTRKAAADTSADQDRIKTATAELAGAEKYAQALGERITYLKAYQAWLQALQYFTEENMYFEESRFELAKAELAKKNNISPPGFNYAEFTRQHTDRKDKVARRKAATEDKRKVAMDARTKWKATQAAADKLTGKPSTFEDPMDKATATGTSIQQGGGSLDVGGGGSATDALVPGADNPVSPAPSTTPDPTPAPTPDPAPTTP